MGLFGNARAKSVEISGQDIKFLVEPRQTILSAALKAGINFPKRCQVGSCGTCKCKLLVGKVKPQIDFEYVLSQEQIQAGYILACQSTLKSDVKIEVKLKERKVDE